MPYEKRRLAPTLSVLKRLIPTLLALAVPAAYAQNTTFTTMSAGNWTSFVAPDSIAAGFFGANFGSNVVTATSLPLATTLGGASVMITDSAGAKVAAPLYMSSSGQINYLIPSSVALGKAMVSMTNSTNTFVGTLEVTNVSPAVFTVSMNGTGVAAAQFLSVAASGQVTMSNAYQPGVLDYVPNPVSLSPSSTKVYLILYGTGIRHHSTNPVIATINGVSVPVLYAGAQSTLPGLDQINLGPLPQSLAGTGKPGLNIIVTVDGIPANTTTIGIQ